VSREKQVRGKAGPINELAERGKLLCCNIYGKAWRKYLYIIFRWTWCTLYCERSLLFKHQAWWLISGRPTGSLQRMQKSKRNTKASNRDILLHMLIVAAMQRWLHLWIPKHNITFLTHIMKTRAGMKVNQSHYRPGQDLRVPGGWGSQIPRQSAHEGW
jgi:hypothetical protein